MMKEKRDMMKEKVAIYLRVSSVKQDEENQMAACKKFCESRNWDVYDVYREQSRSAFKGEQRIKNNLMKDARKGKFNHIVVWALDRWTRRGADQLMVEINKLANWNIKLHSINEEFLDTFNMKGEIGKILREFIQKILGWQAHIESMRKSERVKAAYQRKKQNGEHSNWGRPKVDFDLDKAIELRVKEELGWRTITKEIDADVSFMSVKRHVETAIEEAKKEIEEEHKG